MTMFSFAFESDVSQKVDGKELVLLLEDIPFLKKVLTGQTFDLSRGAGGDFYLSLQMAKVTGSV